MKAKATLKQIAKELNVSVSTVSKALNDSPEISEQTKIKIKEYAKLKNYKPNVIGLNLKNRKTKTIGVIIPNILNSFFAKVFSGIEKVADENGYNVIMCISNESLEKEAHTLEMLSNGTIDGFVLSISEEAQKQHEYNHFKEIISEGFFKDYATQLAIAVANNTGAYDATALCKSLEGINVLKGYEFKIANNYEAALQDLVDLDNLIANSVNQTEEE